jgi:hypothetical protein
LVSTKKLHKQELFVEDLRVCLGIFSKTVFTSQTLKCFLKILAIQTDFQMQPSLLTHFSKHAAKLFPKNKTLPKKIKHKTLL